MEKLTKFFTEDKWGVQIYSFLKTYVVVFLGIYLVGIDSGKHPLDWGFIGETATYSLVSVVRNIWKIATEKTMVK